MVAAIQAAIASLSASLPDASLRMRHGEEAGDVLAVSSRDLTGETVSADGPQEMRRVVGRRCDFPSVAKGSAVELADALHLATSAPRSSVWPAPAPPGASLHLVTSARTDPVGASLTLGLSAALDRLKATYSRRGGRAFPLPVLALEDAAAPSAYADAAGPLEGQTWTVCVVASEWLETSAPSVGDEIRFPDLRQGRAADVRLRVASVVADGGLWTLRARPRGAA